MDKTSQGQIFIIHLKEKVWAEHRMGNGNIEWDSDLLCYSTSFALLLPYIEIYILRTNGAFDLTDSSTGGNPVLFQNW